MKQSVYLFHISVQHFSHKFSSFLWVCKNIIENSSRYNGPESHETKSYVMRYLNPIYSKQQLKKIGKNISLQLPVENFTKLRKQSLFSGYVPLCLKGRFIRHSSRYGRSALEKGPQIIIIGSGTFFYRLVKFWTGNLKGIFLPIFQLPFPATFMLNLIYLCSNFS